MSHYRRLFLSTALLATVALPAVAADYDPPIYIDNAPEYVPVEIGSGWYLRGDVSYNFDGPDYEFTLLGEESENNRFGGAIGVGYHFTDLLRGDVTIGYLGRDKWEYDDGVDAGSALHTAWSGLVSGYLDLGTIAGLTPYVGAGAGVLYTRHEVGIASPTLGATFDWDDSQYRFAYALTAGASYEFTNNLSVDVGYQYLNSPNTEYLDIDTLTVDEGVDYHQIKVGLRYDLW